MKKVIIAAICSLAACAGIAAEEAPTTTPKPQESAAMPSNPSVVISTSLGDIFVELEAVKAPLSVSNFLAYVDAKFYDGTIFHRVIPNFMIQGGGFGPDMRQKPTRAPVKNEAGNGLANSRGTLAMARTMVVDSATAQFFINHADNAFLNQRDTSPQGFGYAVFGKVTAGMDVVDKIAKVPTGNSGGHQNVPTTPVTILKIERQAAAK
jgi:peptidyl-prolyl cis-trans isomerase A (cyclophilin A)